MTCTIKLPSELTICTVAEHRRLWLSALHDTDGVVGVDGSALDCVDGAGLQLLISLARTMEARGVQLRIEGPSATAANACAAMGLQHFLEGADEVRA